MSKDDKCLEIASKGLNLIRIHPRMRSDSVLQMQQFVLRPFLLQFFANLDIAIAISIA